MLLMRGGVVEAGCSSRQPASTERDGGGSPIMGRPFWLAVVLGLIRRSEWWTSKKLR